MTKMHQSVKDYLFSLQSDGTYSFTLERAFDAIDNSEIAIKREIARLSEKQIIKNIRQGFYIIVPPEYAARGTMPVILYIDNLMNSLKRNYQKKLGGLSKISTVLEEIAEEIITEDLKQVVTQYPYLNAVQRLGYLWDTHLGYSELANIIYKNIGSRLKEYIPLKNGSEKKGHYDPKWKIVENTQIETDL